MAASKRTLAAFAAGALLVPLSPFATPAFADHIEIRPIDTACPEGRVSEGNYEDVPPDSGAFEQDINCVTDYGIATGRQPNDFDREFNVTRRQMAQFVYREALLGGVQFDTTTDPGYSDDNDITGEARDAIWGLTNEGVVQGVGGGRFNPNGEVRRDQMATFLVGLADILGLQGFETTEDFFTDDETSVHEANINRIASESVTGGQGGDRIYGPFNPVLRQQMAAFLARVLDIAVEQGQIATLFAPATVTVNEQTVDAGDAITGSITGTGVESAIVTGDCVTGGDLTDTDGATEGIQFSIDTDEDATGGACELTFTTTFEGGGTQTDTETVTINPAPTGATELPELVSAQILSTTTTTQQTPTNPAGTRVQYTFDENVIGGGAPAPRGGAFNVYNSDGSQADTNNGVVESVDDNTVVVNFGNINTAQSAGTLTVATVDTNAVTDTQGDVNPEGDAAIGASGGGNTNLPAGVTNAPDLVSVQNFRQGATTGQTAVDFTFDEAANTTGAGGFSLILVNNPGNTTGTADNDINCTGPAANNNTAGGGTVAGGNGTTTITVVCTNPGGTVGTTQGTAITADQVARGIVDQGTVQESANNEAGNTTLDTNDAVMAVEVSNGGNTFEPDLVSVTFTQGQDTANDTAIFTFDEAVTFTNPGFFAYDVNANPIAGTATQTNGTNGTNSPGTQVLVNFGSNTALDLAVGGFVEDGAVTTQATATTTARPNEEDEVGVANQQQSPSQTPGMTDDPDLTGVSLAQGTNQFGQQTGFTATYTFDEAVNPVAAGNEDLFFLYLADGTRLTGSDCDTGTTTSGTGQNNNTVTCTTFTGGTGTAAQQNQQLGSAVLGTVDNGAVTAVGDNGTNPEGAEFTSGGTGTRTA